MATKDNDKSSGNLKIRGGKKIAEEIKEKSSAKHIQTLNPIKRQIKLNQFPWT